jgi:aryl-alcohol dehydrogenase-like predicted oxidoreductase
MVAAVKLGSSGLMVSRLCLGCMNFGDATPEEEALGILKTAFDAGVFFWDTADRYGNGLSEEIVGKALRQIGRRDQVVVATKVHPQMGNGPNDQGLSRHQIVHAAEASLRRMQTDYIDLYQMHRPSDSTPVEETLQAMDSLVGSGKILYYGTSTFASWQMAEAEWTARTMGLVRPVSEQAPYNLLDRRIENDRAGFIRKYGWGLIAWSPLAGGQLAGRYDRAAVGSLPPGSRAERNVIFRARMNADSVEVSARFVFLCGEAGLEPAAAAVAWLLHQPIVTAPIIGPRTKEHLESLLPATTLKLTPAFLAELDRLVAPGEAVADFLNPQVGWQVAHLPGVDGTS